MRKTNAATGGKLLGLYLHIPFCVKKCAYCDFYSVTDASLKADYTAALIRDIKAYGERCSGYTVDTVYIGGGTPTTLSAAQLRRLMEALRTHIDLTELVEYTVEGGRPDTLDAEKLETIASMGCGRMSINPQTMNDAVLARVGRRHTAAQTVSAYEAARAAGYDAVNMDLIAGLPGDTVAGFEHSLRQAIALDPENITVHTLTLKRASRIVIEDQKENDYADVAAMLEKCHLLAEAGYRPYYLYRQKNTLQNLENVGWCKPGHEGYYNIYIMEEVQTILSAGAGGSTKLVADGGRRMQRIFNFKYPTEYIQRFAEVLERKKGVADFYDHDLGPETSG